MATQSRSARGGGRVSPTDAKKHSTTQDTVPISGRLRSAGGGISSVVSSVTSPSQLQREALAVILMLVTSLSAWVLWSGEDDGQLVHWWAVALDTTFGLGAFVVPILLPLVAFRLLFAGDAPTLLTRHYAGGVLFVVASVGLIESAAKPADSGAGGRLGLAVADIVGGLVGTVGGGLILFVLGAIPVFLITGTDVKTLVTDIRSLLPERRSLEELVDRVELVEGVEASADRSVLSRTTIEATSLLLPPPAPPVINKPRVDERPASGKVDKKAKEATLVSSKSEPMPLPQVGRLALYDGVKLDERELTVKARRIEETLASFKVEARVREINPGPAVTQYTLEPGIGIKVRRITELQNDLALALAAPSIRIEAPVPGMARVGLEIPNAKVATVGLRETLESTSFKSGKQKLPIPLGRDVNGSYVIHDLTKMPHLLIAGATGSGKSVCLTTIISTFLLTRGPDQLKMLMIDPKMVELTGYNGVPHLQCPVVTEMDKVVSALRLVLQEMERRYTLFSKLGVRNLDGYRMKVADEAGAEHLPYLVVIIDELADLMMTAPDEVETLLVRLAQMARATGIHLIIATQRPSVDVLTG